MIEKFMGKRSTNLMNVKNAELLSNISLLLNGCEYHLQSIECFWYKYFPDIELEETDQLRSLLKKVSINVEELEKILPTEMLDLKPKSKRLTKGKGKLNLHETDREVRERKKIERI